VIEGHLENIQEQTTTITIKRKSDTFYYELSISPLTDNKKRLLGHVIVVHDITRHKNLEDGYKLLSEELEERVRERTEELETAYESTLEGWARALELRDKETEGHSRRVTKTTLMVARVMGFKAEELVHIRHGSILHDIGKMGIPDEILHKPGALTNEERNIINEHPTTAYNLLSPVPFLKKALEIPYAHHEKWDGTGYPRGLRGTDIPLAARIFAISDVWDALGSNRSYNAAWPRDQIITYIAEQSGKHFDPAIVNVFLELVEKGEI
jgi:putative nucleotidyltransferase with HDIG domain